MKSGDSCDDDVRSLETLTTTDCESGLASMRSPSEGSSLMQCTTLELVHGCTDELSQVTIISFSTYALYPHYKS